MQVYHHLNREFDSQFNSTLSKTPLKSTTTVEPLSSCVSDIIWSTKSVNRPSNTMPLNGRPICVQIHNC